MKYIIVLGDGMAGRPLEELGGKTTLAAAHTPVMDRLARKAEVGMVSMVPEGMASICCKKLWRIWHPTGIRRHRPQWRSSATARKSAHAVLKPKPPCLRRLVARYRLPPPPPTIWDSLAAAKASPPSPMPWWRRYNKAPAMNLPAGARKMNEITSALSPRPWR